MFYSKKSRSFFSRFGNTSIVRFILVCIHVGSSDDATEFSSTKCGTSKCGT